MRNNGSHNTKLFRTILNYKPSNYICAQIKFYKKSSINGYNNIIPLGKYHSTFTRINIDDLVQYKNLVSKTDKISITEKIVSSREEASTTDMVMQSTEKTTIKDTTSLDNILEDTCYIRSDDGIKETWWYNNITTNNNNSLYDNFTEKFAGYTPSDFKLPYINIKRTLAENPEFITLNKDILGNRPKISLDLLTDLVSNYVSLKLDTMYNLIGTWVKDVESYMDFISGISEKGFIFFYTILNEVYINLNLAPVKIVDKLALLEGTLKKYDLSYTTHYSKQLGYLLIEKISQLSHAFWNLDSFHMLYIINATSILFMIGLLSLSLFYFHMQIIGLLIYIIRLIENAMISFLERGLETINAIKTTKAIANILEGEKRKANLEKVKKSITNLLKDIKVKILTDTKLANSTSKLLKARQDIFKVYRDISKCKKKISDALDNFSNINKLNIILFNNHNYYSQNILLTDNIIYNQDITVNMMGLVRIRNDICELCIMYNVQHVDHVRCVIVNQLYDEQANAPNIISRSIVIVPYRNDPNIWNKIISLHDKYEKFKRLHTLRVLLNKHYVKSSRDNISENENRFIIAHGHMNDKEKDKLKTHINNNDIMLTQPTDSEISSLASNINNPEERNLKAVLLNMGTRSSYMVQSPDIITMIYNILEPIFNQSTAPQGVHWNIINNHRSGRWVSVGEPDIYIQGNFDGNNYIKVIVICESFGKSNFDTMVQNVAKSGFYTAGYSTEYTNELLDENRVMQFAGGSQFVILVRGTQIAFLEQYNFSLEEKGCVAKHCLVPLTMPVFVTKGIENPDLYNIMPQYRSLCDPRILFPYGPSSGIIFGNHPFLGKHYVFDLIKNYEACQTLLWYISRNLPRIHRL
uniref:Uncharacterized protein n=1 Tax=Leptogium hirsutum TaxID=1486872 RepID=A0A1X9QGX9_9LECA|nr:hypothetical protein [Leptogium hirsutum]ARQ27105.1 hypothetical protein [Leptogium hirsutum]